MTGPTSAAKPAAQAAWWALVACFVGWTIAFYPRGKKAA
jgi:hypothetical protein